MHADEQVVLLTTVTDEEFKAVQTIVRDEYQRPHTPGLYKGRYVTLGTFGAARVYLTQARMGSAGFGRMQDVTTKGIEDLSPVAVINVGIAFGIDDRKQAIGDVLLAEKLVSFGKIRVDQGGDGQPAYTFDGDQPAAPLFRPFSMLANSWVPPLASENQKIQVHKGALLCGPFLLNNAAVREQLRQLAQRIIGGEMEGEGLYGAVAGTSNGIGWMVIKAICDFGADKNVPSKDADQWLAALNAARFVLYAIKHGAVADLEQPASIRSPDASSVTVSGDRNVVVGGNVRGSIVTGDRSTADQQ